MKKKLLILLGIIIIGGGAAGVSWKMGLIGSATESTDAAFVAKVSEITGATSGVSNRYAGVVEPQQTVKVELESGRSVKEVQVEVGDEVKEGQLLFEYDLSSIEDSLEEAQLEYDQLVNEANSLTEQIAALEKEKKSASKDNQLSYTIEIETDKMNLKKNEYNQKSKQAEITKLQEATGNTEVRSTIDGVIQKIDTSKLSTGDDSDTTDTSSYSDNSSGDSNAFITILSTGAYRIKGTVNELNASDIVEGEPVIIRSRVDETQTWNGTMGNIDRDSATTSSSDSYYGMIDSSGDSQTTSSTYPFYVDLDSSDGLMLGQHVYIEKDEGQEEQKSGLWLSEAYIVDADTDSPYVWARDDSKKLEKRSVILGQYDENLGEYEIADSLEKGDYIAYPSDLLEVGMSTTTDSSQAIDMEVTSDDYSDDYSDDTSLDDVDSEEPSAEEDMEELDDTDMTDADLEADDSDLEEIADDGTMDLDMGDLSEDSADISSADSSDMEDLSDADLSEAE